MKTTLQIAVTATFALLVAAADCSGGGGGGQVINPDDNFATCSTSEECPAGHVCSGGACSLGTCDPILENACDTTGLDSPYCCKPWELCSGVSFSCESDPQVKGIGCSPDDENCTPCEVQDDCGAGQFCSGATCFDAAGREACTSSFQCPGGERCDRNVFLCVPDRGGCSFCTSFPELCCEAGQVCSEQTGFCQDVPEPECSADEDCQPGLLCDELQRCVQCVADSDCGPNLACDEGVGDCFPINSTCETDEDCLGNKRCSVAQRLCVLPECESNNDCEDSRERCDLSSFQCFLPAAQCTESDEENDTANTATPLLNGTSYAGVLCRGDSDFLSFPVVPNRRYTATVDFGGSGQAGISVVMLDTAQVVESSSAFTDTQRAVQVAGVSGPNESGTFFMKVSGTNTDRDQWNYTVTLREDEPSQPADCSEAGQPEEPNNDFATAEDLIIGQTRTFSRCGTGDVDFYRIPVSALHGVSVTVAGFYNAEGNLNVELFKEPNTNTGSRVDQGNSVNDVEIVDNPEGPAEYWLKVTLSSSAGAVSNQTYTITASEVPRPAECSSDATENDGSIDTAVQLTLTPDENGSPGSSSAGLIRCNPQDQDFYALALPPNLGGSVRITFVHNEGDMALDLLDENGAQIATSNTSNTMIGAEQVSLPGSATDTVPFYVRVRLAGTSGGSIAQRYGLEVTTFDNAQCIASEPAGGDNSFAAGRCVGEAANYPANSPFPCSSFIPEPLVAPALNECIDAPIGSAGCGRTCGNDDSDFYRVGLLKNDQTLHAVLTFDKTVGDLDLVRASLSGTTVSETTVSGGTNGRIELYFVETNETGKEYALRVKPKGNVGHELQPYSLTLEVGASCDDDPNDQGTAANEKPVQATLIDPSTGPVTVSASRCNNDVDVYKLIVLAGETITVELEQLDPSPNGLQAELGRPAALTNLPDPTAGEVFATALAGGGPVSFAGEARQDLYIVVRPRSGGTPAVNVTGPYTLRVTNSVAP